MSLSSMPAVPVTTTPLCLLKLTFSRFAQQGCHQLCALFPHECCLPCGCEFSSPYGFLQPLLRMGLGHYQWRFLLPPRYALRCSCSFFSEWSHHTLSDGVFSFLDIEKLVGLQRWVIYTFIYTCIYALSLYGNHLLPIFKRSVSPFQKLNKPPLLMLELLELSTSSVHFSLLGMGCAQYFFGGQSFIFF